MKIIHIADLHFRKDKYFECEKSFNNLFGFVTNNNVDCVLISGDIWDGPIQNSASYCYPGFLNLMFALADKCPIFMIYGTPTHDIPGSLEVFSHHENITILPPMNARIYKNVLFLGIPEINKKWFFAKDNTRPEDLLNKMFIELRQIRESYSDKRCVVLYHGQLSGAKLDNNNIIGSNAMTPSVDHFKMLNADYIAMGDIHRPQLFTEINAYYSGSIYPNNWGESHDCGFNLIKFDNWDMKINRYSFGHPVQKKVKILHTQTPILSSLFDFKKKKINLEVISEQDKKIIKSEYEEILKKYGAHPDSIVTLNIKPVETVRTEEIKEAHTIYDKCQVWAKNSDIEIPAGVKDKIDSFDQKLYQKSYILKTNIRIDKLKLRGSIGIKKGQGKDEIEIDFSKYDPGLIALIGENGSGKTTIIENMHPWPQLITRDGKLQKHFYLKDSWRELHFTDTKKKIQYKSLLMIDASIETGKVQYFLYYRDLNNLRFDDRYEWNPVDEITGRKDAYLQKISKLFGSIDLYLKSVFSSQKAGKNNPSLSAATKGQKKELFAELTGISYIQSYADTAKEEVRKLQNEITFLSGIISNQPELESSIIEKEKSIEKGKDLIKTKEKEYDDNKKSYDEVTSEYDSMKEEFVKFRNVKEQIVKESNLLNQNDSSIHDLKHLISDHDILGKKISEYNVLKSSKGIIESELRKKNETNLSIVKKYNDELLRYSSKIQSHENRISEQVRQLQGIEHEIITLRCNLKKITETCPTCNQPWPELEKMQAMQKNKEIELKIEEKQKELDKEIEFLRIFKIEKNAEQRPKKQKLENTKEIITELNEIESKLSLYDINDLIEKFEISRHAADKITFFNDENNKIISRMRELEALPCLEFNEKKFLMLKTEQEYFKTNVKMIRDQLIRYDARFEELQKQLSEEQEKLKKLKKIKVELSEKETEKTDYEFIQKACGKDGIQALELDAIGPTIAHEANRFLQEIYNSPFRIKFETTRISGTGSKTKQIEDFNIIVVNSQDGTEQDLSTLSGGEEVQVNNSIYEAFGIVRSNMWGCKFLTTFHDEADGALDQDAKIKYLQMRELAHKIQNRNHTILITHNKGIQDMIQQKIDLTRS